MASMFDDAAHSATLQYRGRLERAPALARAMSIHAALALLTFAALQIAGVVLLANRPGGAVLPFIALVALLLLAIPFARRIERRWRRLSDNALPCAALHTCFRRDRWNLWRAALAVPPLWLASYAVVARAAGL